MDNRGNVYVGQGENMAQVSTKMNTSVKDVKAYFSWFYDEFTFAVNELLSSYWQIDANVKLFSLEKNSKNFFLGNEYFVTQAQTHSISYSIRVSDTLCEMFLSATLGENGKKSFSLQSMTELEGNLIFRFNNRLFKKLKEYFISNKEIKNLAEKGETFNDVLCLGFLIEENSGNYEIGKLFINIPAKLIEYPELPETDGVLDITKFKKAQTPVDIYVGKTKLSLDEINNIEHGDIVVLENSDIKKMAITNPAKIEFNVNPDPRLFMNEDDTDDNMEDKKVSAKDIWDNVQVDVCAKFPKVKMSLGELREMSEGVVMELDSVYGNEVVLEVENKNVAKGELVIIGYKYGVKITEIYDRPKDAESEQSAASGNGEDDFDVKDFEIEE